jgi:hypothetical protein
MVRDAARLDAPGLARGVHGLELGRRHLQGQVQVEVPLLCEGKARLRLLPRAPGPRLRRPSPRPTPLRWGPGLGGAETKILQGWPKLQDLAQRFHG